ncbi:hypothetical protein LBMAG49_26870 [Planctomycetota bacterium]|nr:hypothetical protein LBMAG49_26870 [Planctomycetota bacterium]
MATFPIVCESCSANYSLPLTFVSARAKCKKCGHSIDVAGQRGALPAQSTEPAPIAAKPPVTSAPKKPTANTAKPPAASDAKPAVTSAVPRAASAPLADHDEASGKVRARGIDIKRAQAEQNSKVMKIAWTIAGIMCLIGAIFVFVATSSRNERARLVQEEKQHRQEIVARLEKNDLSNLDKILADIQFIDEEKATWQKFSDVSTIIVTWRGKANARASELRNASGTVDSLNEIEKKLAGNPGPEVLENLYKDVRGELDGNCKTLGDSYKDRLFQLRKQVDTTYVEALANKSATDSLNAKEGSQLLSSGQYEDVLRMLAEEATIQKDADAASNYNRRATETFKAINGIVETLFDKAYQDRVQWKDLLADPSNWEATPSETLTYKFTGSGLVVTNAPGETSKTGGIFYKTGRNWRDYVAEIEMKVDSGVITVYTRIGELMDTKKVPGISLGKEKVDVQIEYDQPIAAIFSIIGGQFRVMINGEERKSDTVGRALSRKGPVGIAVKAGTNVTITKFRARHLR